MIGVYVNFPTDAEYEMTKLDTVSMIYLYLDIFVNTLVLSKSFVGLGLKGITIFKPSIEAWLNIINLPDY